MKWTRPYRPFVLISHLRSGTHMLRTALDSHPQIRCQAEPFNANSPNLPYPSDTSTQDILNGWVFPSQPEEIQAVGFVLHSYHPGGSSENSSAMPQVPAQRLVSVPGMFPRRNSKQNGRSSVQG